MNLLKKTDPCTNAHRSLTFLFTAVVSIVIVVMLLGYLYLSEIEWREKNFLSFLNTSNTILSNLEHQDTLSVSWLSTIADDNHFIIAIYDNGSLLTHSENHLTVQEKKLAASALSQASETLSNPNNTSPEFAYIRKHFMIQDENENSWYANTARFGTASTLYAVILSSTASLEQQFARQRLQLLTGTLAGLAVLFLFFSFWVKKLLAPVQESQKRQTEFIAAASHELRTPLAVIRSALSALNKAEGEERRKFTYIIEKESRRMSALLNNLLFLTSTAALSSSQSEHDTTRKPTELDTLLLNVYESFLPLASEKQIRLQISLPETPVSPILCNSSQISQLMEILLSNALSYGKKGGCVWLALSYQSPYFVLTVKDNGCGISDTAKPRIFERFYREDPSRSEKEHFGLGLCIAKEIINSHSGRITVSDTPGGGATFTVYLPDNV